jgi:diguanylate cyclase (GGDEF)-like protein
LVDYLSIAYFDMDYFKAVNDTYGHQKGDEVLRAIANIILNACKNDMSAYRLGGEEF